MTTEADLDSPDQRRAMTLRRALGLHFGKGKLGPTLGSGPSLPGAT